MLMVTVMRVVTMLTVVGIVFVATLFVRALMVMLAHSRFPFRSPAASFDADRPPSTTDEIILSAR